MTRQTELDGDSAPDAIQLPGAFDIGFGIGSAPETHADITQAQDYLNAAKAAINRNLQSEVVKASVDTAMLKGRVADSLTVELKPAADLLNDLQEKIQLNVIGALGAGMEMAAPLGVQIPTPETMDVLPESVAVRKEAREGKADTAIAIYMRDAYPRRFAKDLEYQRSISTIVSYMVNFPEAIAIFRKSVENIENAVPGGTGGGSGVSPSPSQTSQNSNPLTPGTQPWPVSGVPMTGTPCSYPPLMNRPDLYPLTWSKAVAMGSVPREFPTQIDCQPYPMFLNNAQLSAAFNDPPTRTAGPVTYEQTVSNGMVLRYIVSSISDGIGGCWKIGATSLCPITGAFSDPDEWTVGVCPSGGNPLPPDCPPQQPCPEPPTCQPCPTPTPPPTNPPCIKLCPPDEPPECKDKKWCIYETSEGTCYIIEEGDEPRSISDKKITCGTPSNEWIDVLKDCGKTKPPTPTPPPYPGDIPVGNFPVVGCGQFGSVPGITLPEGLAGISKLFGVRRADGSLNVPPLEAGSLNPVTLVGQWIWGAGANLLDQFGKLTEAIVSQSGCVSGEQISLAAANVVLGFINGLTNGSLNFAQVPIKQQSNFLCPVNLPDPQEATTAYLADNITLDTWRCWVRAAGCRDDEFLTVADGQRTKLSSLQQGVLYLRDEITEADYLNRIRANGMLRNSDASDVMALLKQIPPATDLVRFMVRDTADQELVDKFEMDCDFTKKFDGKIPEWARKQGIDETYMRYMWRAHWSIPAPGQLFEMYHRGRNLPPNDPAFVDEATIRTALEQQDILPYWIDKFLAISFRPLTRIDARRAYQVGAINKQQLHDAWTDQGYNDKNATILTDFTDKQRKLTLLRSPWINQYAQGQITEQEMLHELTQEGMRQPDVADVQQRAGTKLAGIRRKRCVSAYRKRFLTGEFTIAKANGILTNLGLTPNQAKETVDGWDCEKSAIGKHFSASQLCSLMEDSLIDGVEFIRRAELIGFDHNDSVILFRQCQKRLGRKTDAAEERRIKREQMDAEKRARQTKAAIKEAEAASRRNTSLAEKGQRATALRNRRILETAKNLANLWKSDVIDEIPRIQQIYRAISADTVALADEIINGLIVVSQSKQVGGIEEFEAAVRAFISDLVESGTEETNGSLN